MIWNWYLAPPVLATSLLFLPDIKEDISINYIKFENLLNAPLDLSFGAESDGVSSTTTSSTGSGNFGGKPNSSISLFNLSAQACNKLKDQIKFILKEKW